MEIKYLITVVLAVPVLFLTIMSIVIFFGYGGGMIAGYHFDAEGSAAKKYHNFIMRRIGSFMLFITITFFGGITLNILGFKAIGITMMVLSGVSIIPYIAYMHCNKKIRNYMQLEKELTLQYLKDNNPDATNI